LRDDRPVDLPDTVPACHREIRRLRQQLADLQWAHDIAVGSANHLRRELRSLDAERCAA
jgi:hypothetical protein